MAGEQQTFSESWYRIEGQRLALRPGVRVKRHTFRGQRWIVLENPFSNQFFRLTPAAYEFVARLRPDRSVGEVWKECLERFPDTAPGQEAVIQLLSQLYFANLLQYTVAGDTEQLFERYRKRRQRETRSRLLQIMFMRFPLLDPDAFLVRTLPVVGKLITPIGGLIWLAVVFFAAKLGIDHFPELKDQSQGILSPSNWLLLYAGLVVVKTLHEFGHAYFCRKFGGEVHVMGVMLLIFTPIPYMDATSSWGFRSRWKRALVGAAGMIVEVFVAAVAMFVWAQTGPGVINSLAYNMVFIASVSTVLFNINPLLRFDGYYILSDLLDIPNLHQRAGKQIRHWIEGPIFGVKKSESPAMSRREAGWLTVFGISSGIYRVFIFGVILLFVADRFLLLGLIMAAICLVSWIIVPIGKMVNYFASSPRLERTRFRACTTATCFFLGLLSLLQFVPLPHHFRAPGVVLAAQWTEVVNDVPGTVVELMVMPGQRVEAGNALIRLANPELDWDLQAARASRDEVSALLRNAIQGDTASVKPLTSRLQAIEDRIERLEEDRRALTVRARQSGIWVAPRMDEYVGRWIRRGTSTGLIVDPSQFEVFAIVSQSDANSLFEGGFSEAQVRLYGQSDAEETVRDLRVIPAEQNVLPTSALGWRSGGDVAVAVDDPEGRRTAEPFFEVRGSFAPGAERSAEPESDDALLLHGRTGKVRFRLEPKPLLPRMIRRIRQLLQERYQV